MCGIVGLVLTSERPPAPALDQAVALAAGLRAAARPGAPPDDLAWPAVDLERLSLALVNPRTAGRLAAGEGRDALERIRIDLEAALAVVSRNKAGGGGRTEAWNRLSVLLEDAHWRLTVDLAEIADWIGASLDGAPSGGGETLRARLFELAVTLRSVDRLEVRGRDSAGILCSFAFPDEAALDGFLAGPGAALGERLHRENLVSGAVLRIRAPGCRPHLVFVHKVAEEIGRLGQNVEGLTGKIRADEPLLALLDRADVTFRSLAHTRWASNGIINEENCHPVDSRAAEPGEGRPAVFAVLNGDIDNYPALARELAADGVRVPPAITTDAKIIPLCIEAELGPGISFREAFCRAARRFEGSFAIAAVTTAEPEAVYLAQRGSGQALYVGRNDDGFIFASEIYGLVETADAYRKLEDDGEGEGEGRVFRLAAGPGARPTLEVFDFDGSDLVPAEPVPAAITTRDIHRGDFDHFFLKEICESSESLAKTIRGRFRVETTEAGTKVPRFDLEEEIASPDLLRRIQEDEIRRVVCIGQGTASVAGEGIAALFRRVFGVSRFQVSAMKASELSAHGLRRNMEDTLVVAVSQSGTTTDTNRTVDLARKRGAAVLAVVNRRNSDLTDKADGVLYTSDGRDVEMSVASTKAFYCQVAAGYLFALYLAHVTGAASDEEIARRLDVLDRLPDLLRQTLDDGDRIRAAAERWALKKRHWAVVGSGLDRVAAEEVRIKLSELNYKSISCDITEDKKHIDLSAEPLILVMAVNLQEANLQDTVKEVSIFKAHRARPIVVAAEGQRAFDGFAAAVLPIRPGAGDLAFLLATMVGHLWGYYAARAIDASARVLRSARAAVVAALPEIRRRTGFALAQTAGMLARQLASMGQEFRSGVWEGRYNSALEVETSSRLLSLFDYACGRARLQNLRGDFGIPPRWDALHDEFLGALSTGIGELTRPIDAIKHQAKTVTVGISREEIKLTGVLFEKLQEVGLGPDDLEYGNLTVVEFLSEAIEAVEGHTLYAVHGLDDMYRPDDATTIAVAGRGGAAAAIPSRYDRQRRLTGTKLSVAAKGRVFIGLGKRDGRPIVIIPTLRRDGEGGGVPMVLFHVAFKTDLGLDDKVRILKNYYERYEEIRWAVGEFVPGFDDACLGAIPVAQLLALNPDALAEKIARSVTPPDGDDENTDR